MRLPHREHASRQNRSQGANRRARLNFLCNHDQAGYSNRIFGPREGAPASLPSLPCGISLPIAWRTSASFNAYADSTTGRTCIPGNPCYSQRLGDRAALGSSHSSPASDEFRAFSSVAL